LNGDLHGHPNKVVYALNVEKPIYIARIEFDREAGELHVYMDFERGSRFNFDSRLTAGLSESINSRIKEVKRKAKSFRNIDNFISMVYLECSNLSLPAFV